MLLCWAQAASDALLGCCIMLASAYVAVRGGVLRSSPHQAPLLKLVVGLGLVCGCAGCASSRVAVWNACHSSTSTPPMLAMLAEPGTLLTVDFVA